MSTQINTTDKLRVVIAFVPYVAPDAIDILVGDQIVAGSNDDEIIYEDVTVQIGTMKSVIQVPIDFRGNILNHNQKELDRDMAPLTGLDVDGIDHSVNTSTPRYEPVTFAVADPQDTKYWNPPYSVSSGGEITPGTPVHYIYGRASYYVFDVNTEEQDNFVIYIEGGPDPNTKWKLHAFKSECFGVNDPVVRLIKWENGSNQTSNMTPPVGTYRYLNANELPEVGVMNLSFNVYTGNILPNCGAGAPQPGGARGLVSRNLLSSRGSVARGQAQSGNVRLNYFVENVQPGSGLDEYLPGVARDYYGTDFGSDKLQQDPFYNNSCRVIRAQFKTVLTKNGNPIHHYPDPGMTGEEFTDLESLYFKLGPVIEQGGELNEYTPLTDFILTGMSQILENTVVADVPYSRDESVVEYDKRIFQELLRDRGSFDLFALRYHQAIQDDLFMGNEDNVIADEARSLIAGVNYKIELTLVITRCDGKVSYVEAGIPVNVTINNQDIITGCTGGGGGSSPNIGGSPGPAAGI